MSSKTKKADRVYTKKHYMSGDGMLTSVWGPSMWHYLHTMSFNYPVKPTLNDKQQYKKFMLSLQHTLPCKHCRDNLKKNFKTIPLTNKVMESRNTFSRYVYTLHETVNHLLGKKSGLSYCDVRERYENFRARCKIDAPNLLTKKHLKTITKKSKKEKGCTEPLYGKKAKCIIKIVPQTSNTKTFQLSKKCLTRRHK